MHRILHLTFILLLPLSVLGQFFIDGQEPSWVKWREHNARHGKIIFPNTSDSLVSVYSKYMNYAWDAVPQSLKHKPRKTPVIFHSNSILSNGFVSWAPRRTEIVSTPSFDSSPEPWLLTMALHETRHVVQVDKLNQGVFRFAYFLLGEQAVGAAAGLVPRWFLEGDAVYTETELSRGGRGRQASFYQHYRAHVLNNQGSKYSYDKWLLGSYKDIIPNHYNFGYLMVGYANSKYGSDIWSNALNWVAKRPYSLFPFYFSIKKDIGLSRKELFFEAVQHLDSIWREDKSASEKSQNFNLLKNEEKFYTKYNYPYLIDDSTLISLKSSVKKPPAIMQIDISSGKEKVLHRPGYITSRVNYSENSILWSQYKAHPRWEYLNYSDVFRYDLKTDTLIKIDSKTRYFCPIDFEPNIIAVVENTPEGKYYISIMWTTGKVIKKVATPSSLELKEICKDNEQKIYARCSSPNGTVILRYNDLETTPDTILGPTFRDISNIVASNAKLYFTMTHNFNEDVFALDIETGSVYSINKSKFGLTDISLYKDNVIVASAFTENGFYPVTVQSLEYLQEVDISSLTKPLYNEGLDKFFDPDVIEETGVLLSSSKHKKINNLFHFHSWAPMYYNPSKIMNGSYEVYPGATLLSQNLTSTLVSSVGYSYNETHGLHAQIEWLGFYPKFLVGANYGNEYSLYRGGDLNGQQSDPLIDVNGRIRIPYRISSGYINSGINFGLNYFYSNTKQFDYNLNSYIQGQNILEPFVSFYAMSRMAHRDIRPMFGGYFYGGNIQTPFDEVYGTSSIVKTGLYLPGLFSNQSIQVAGQWEKQTPLQYLLSSRLTFPRGVERVYVKSASSLSIDYALPLAYLDLPLGPIVYIKRLFANVFSDNLWANQYVSTSTGTAVEFNKYQSVGIDINANVHLFRTPYEFNVGYRVGVTLNEKDFFHDLIFFLDFNSIYGYFSNNHFIR